jgi:toxin YoeB
MSYKLDFSEQAKDDIRKIKKSGNKALYKKLLILLEELIEHPTTGTGKPELLKHIKEPSWSRRISREHRLVYTIEGNTVTVLILSAWGHYDDK